MVTSNEFMFLVYGTLAVDLLTLCMVIWVVGAIRRINREQEFSLLILRALTAREGFKEAIDAIQAGRRVTDLKDRVGL